MRPVDIFISSGIQDQEVVQFAIDARIALARAGVDVCVVWQNNKDFLKKRTYGKDIEFDLSTRDKLRFDAVTLIVSVPQNEPLAEDFAKQMMSTEFGDIIFALNAEQTNNACYSIRDFDHSRTLATITASDSVFSTDAAEEGASTLFNDCAIIDINSTQYNSSDVYLRPNIFFSYQNGRVAFNYAVNAFKALKLDTDSTFHCFEDSYSFHASKAMQTSRFGYFMRNSGLTKVLLEMIACNQFVIVDTYKMKNYLESVLKQELSKNIVSLDDDFDHMLVAEEVDKAAFKKFSFEKFADQVLPFLSEDTGDHEMI